MIFGENFYPKYSQSTQNLNKFLDLPSAALDYLWELRVDYERAHSELGMDNTTSETFV